MPERIRPWPGGAMIQKGAFLFFCVSANHFTRDQSIFHIVNFHEDLSSCIHVLVEIPTDFKIKPSDSNPRFFQSLQHFLHVSV